MIHFNQKQSGFTLLELMVVIAIIAIILTVAIPSMTRSFATSDVRSAQQDIVKSIKKAKQFAKTLNTTVTMTMTLNTNSNTINFTLPNGTDTLPDGTRIIGVTLPAKVKLTSTNNAAAGIHTFNAMGLIDSTDTITVTSSTDATVTESVSILNLFAQLGAS